ncbi:hypothetical protein OIV83_002449 [Microbotryomycetes sp. JL201]|nr:hypothetical protein OIV83_002449 [Microbotryomycetes sp. JL201]
MSSTYEELSAQLRQQVNSKLRLDDYDWDSEYPAGSDVRRAAERVLTPRQLEITSMDATALLKQIATSKVTAVEALMAFGARTAVAHRLTCCLTDLFIDEALQQARQLDQHLKETGTTVGPLHGLPISAKARSFPICDQVQLKGRITSLSFLSLHLRAKPEEQDCLLADVLRSSGAIFFNHTTLPQSIMHLESSSFWTGATGTRNPYNTLLSSGGSSGGEGAVLGMRGALIGIGSKSAFANFADIGGSVRSPAAACGLYGLRPTALRVPGVATYKVGRETIMGTAGPMAHSARDIELFMSVVLGDRNKVWLRDPNVLEMPWRCGRRGEWQDGSRKLRIGIMWEDGEVRPTKPIERAMRTVVQQLQKSDQVEVKDFAAYGTREAWYLARELYFPDGGRRIRDLTINSDTQEPLHPLTLWLLDESGPVLKEKTPAEIWEARTTGRRDVFRKRYRQHWLDQEIDVLLCPNAPYPAPPHGTAKWWAYTSHFNVVDYPAVTFPLDLQVDPALDAVNSRDYFDPRNDDEAVAHADYSPERYRNAPLCLQLVGRRFHDEEVLDALQVIETVLAQTL